MYLKQAYDDHMPESDATGLECKDQTKTQQQFKEECDILTIVERFGLTGEMPQVLHVPTYGDFSGIFDYQTAMNAIVAARESFDSLPANIRARFHNDPQELVDFASDEGNKDEAIKLGLVEKPQVAVKPAPGAETPPPAAPAPLPG